MKILYLSDTDLDGTSGVAQKILMQSNQWSKQGHHVSLVSLESLSFFSFQGERLTEPKIDIKRRGWKIFVHLLLSTWRLKKILKTVDYDIVYMRYRLYSPFLKRALGYHPQIVEINTDDINEYKFSSKLLYFYNKFFRHLFLQFVDGLVCVSHELQQKFEYLSKPSIVIGNGINTDMYAFEQSTGSKRPSLVFIGSPSQQWHGVDKIIFLAEKLIEFDFHIIGMDGENRDNLFFHGYLSNDKAKDLVKDQDIGIGTLSLYENKMTEASPLKTRQYFAHGLPVIYAYEDTDIKGKKPFILKLPNTKTNIEENIEEIRDFVLLVYHDNKVRQLAREFAEKKLDVSVKENQKIEFFDMILQSESC
ncbi:glycosyltransferase family 4 protein [Sulfurovum sp. XGS-02]|uniref:glycosyltransferase family 4 protein n=1 Tax=Sulfurovum sp. XGS-02 TaxID=2925411 RepID=UPI0020672102|nr:glycosyltransferase family 4 protein [Sulfurovum sp. XGS-02]UPT77641.1 glycosyltransferase family 4 protein [Sulfurovum sp. XGS-02]